ncbi:MAG: hypothetical protein ACRDIY_13755 [Chloroflexota bacterium]
MAIDAVDPPSDHAFAERVLRRVERVEQKRRRWAWLRYLVPASAIVILAAAWLTAVPMGMTVIRFVIEGVAWLRVIGAIEQELGGALLGPFAPLPSIVSLLLFLAAIVWVRMHQPGPSGWSP